jgi:regulator of Ty1 transposition protein 103
MSYTDDAMRAKLSSLNEAQDTIVTVAQWILFHKYVNPNSKTEYDVY